MLILKNENILKLTFVSFNITRIKSFLDNINNSTICAAILRILTLDSMSFLMKKSKIIKHGIRIISMSLLPNGYLATITPESINIWDINNYSCIKTINQNSAKCVIVVSNDIMAISFTWHIKLYEINNNYYNETRIITYDDYSFFHKLIPLPNGLVACIAKKGNGMSNVNSVFIFNINNDIPIHLYTGQRYMSDLVTLSNCRIACASSEAITVWDLKGKYECIKSIPCKASSLLFMEKKNYIIAGSLCNIFIWDASDNFELVKIIRQFFTSEITCLLLLTDDYFASGSSERCINFWDVNSYRCINTLEGYIGVISSLLLFKRCCLISFSQDNTLRLWDYKNK
jgi:WD40 repeat protein